MLTSNVIEGSNIVTVTYDGPLHAEEMVAVRERLTTVVRERGSARLLVEYGTVDLGRIELRAMWEDLRTAGVLMDLTRVAVVAEPGWIETLASMVGTALPVEVRSFGRDQRDHAVAWLYAYGEDGDTDDGSVISLSQIRLLILCVEQWQIGDVGLPPTDIAVLDLPSPPHGQGLQGLRGSNVLSGFDYVVVDYDDQRPGLPPA